MPLSLYLNSRCELLRTTGGLILHRYLYAAPIAVADLLMRHAASAAELVIRLHVNERALYRVLRLLSGQGVFEEIACQTFADSPHPEYLRSDVPGSLRPLLIIRIRGSQ